MIDTRLCHEIRLMILDDLGLLPALRALAERDSARSKLPTAVEGELQVRPAPNRLGPVPGH